jgi:hypothetical protein
MQLPHYLHHLLLRQQVAEALNHEQSFPGARQNQVQGAALKLGCLRGEIPSFSAH